MRRIYDILNCSGLEDRCEATVRFDATHSVFAGHFPGRPVVPGVCMLQMIASVIERVEGRPVVMTALANVKYAAVIDPLETPEVHVSVKLSRHDDSINASAEIRTANKSFMKCKGVFA